MGKLFEISPGIRNSNIFDLADSQIEALDEDTLHLLKKRMAVKYQRNVLRARGPFRDDYFFAMNDRRSVVDSELISRSLDRQAQILGLSALEFRVRLYRAESEIMESDPLATPGSPRLARAMIDRGLAVSSHTLDSLQDVENVIAKKNAQQEESE
jgi:hypothetical protein